MTIDQMIQNFLNTDGSVQFSASAVSGTFNLLGVTWQGAELYSDHEGSIHKTLTALYARMDTEVGTIIADWKKSKVAAS